MYLLRYICCEICLWLMITQLVHSKFGLADVLGNDNI